jgi:hypothetical protein
LRVKHAKYPGSRQRQTVEPELHKYIAIQARKRGKSLNAWVSDARIKAIKKTPNKGMLTDPESLRAFGPGNARRWINEF